MPTQKEAAAIFGAENFVCNSGFVYLKDIPHKVVIVGFGKVNAAITMTKYLRENLLDGALPVLIGIAGTYRETGLAVGDAVMIKNDFFVDEALLLDNKIKCTNELGFPICGDNKTVCVTPFSLPICDANTVSLLSGTDSMAKLYHYKTNASTESMEGAAFVLAAASFGIKTAQVRAISNYCGARNTQNWDIKRAFATLRRFVNNL